MTPQTDSSVVHAQALTLLNRFSASSCVRRGVHCPDGVRGLPAAQGCLARRREGLHLVNQYKGEAVCILQSFLHQQWSAKIRLKDSVLATVVK